MLAGLAKRDSLGLSEGGHLIGKRGAIRLRHPSSRDRIPGGEIYLTPQPCGVHARSAGGVRIARRFSAIRLTRALCSASRARTERAALRSRTAEQPPTERAPLNGP